MKTRTYVDANVLISAFQGKEPIASRCLEVLDDPLRILVVSDFVRLEVLPQPLFHKRSDEINFMQSVLNAAENVQISSVLTQFAFQFARTYSLSPMDALHAAAAYVGRVDELVTVEKPTKPLCQLRELNVVSLYVAPI